MQIWPLFAHNENDKDWTACSLLVFVEGISIIDAITVSYNNSHIRIC